MYHSNYDALYTVLLFQLVLAIVITMCHVIANNIDYVEDLHYKRIMKASSMLSPNQLIVITVHQLSLVTTNANLEGSTYHVWDCVSLFLHLLCLGAFLCLQMSHAKLL